MNLNEFKAWFEGFTEAMDHPPSAKQWKRIKERVAEIVPQSTPWPVFVNRYLPVYPAPVWPQPYWGPVWSSLAGGATGQCNNAGLNDVTSHTMVQEQFTPTVAFTQLGRLDAQAIN
jgi:hypothetical protein